MLDVAFYFGFFLLSSLMQEVNSAHFQLACFIQVPHGLLNECPASWSGDNSVQLPGLVSVNNDESLRVFSQINMSGIRLEKL